ncbi:unnamed protein product [Oikopleura dioica]|uniref:Uncharacterized protein n=1 Tax=Oikopleura dioica TaxID=34765 RepID=E4XW92_OIKDI|nr:unnamed protein product [Oikopleura dioica]
MTVTRVLVLIDDTLSMAGIHPETNRSYLDTAKIIASDFLDALADSRFDVHIVAQTRDGNPSRHGTRHVLCRAVSQNFFTARHGRCRAVPAIPYFFTILFYFVS